MSSTTEVIRTTSTSTDRRRTSYRRDPATAALVIIVAATALLRPAAAAPVSQDLSADFDSWWYNACGHHGVHSPAHHNKHSDNCADLGDVVPNRSRNQVRRQMRIFLGSFRKELHSINNTYEKVLDGFSINTQPAFNWLPKFKASKKNKSKVLLRSYHSDLQKYVVAVHYLATLKLETDAVLQWQEKREELLIKLSNDMKGLLCEIETAVNATCQTLPKRIPASFAYDNGLNKKLKDITELYIVDWGVLKRFENFMEKSSKLVSYLPQKELDSAELEADHEESATLSAEAGGE